MGLALPPFPGRQVQRVQVVKVLPGIPVAAVPTKHHQFIVHDRRGM